MVAPPGMAATIPAMKVTPYPLCISWRIKRETIGLMELLAAWMIRVVTRRPKMTRGSASWFKTPLLGCPGVGLTGTKPSSWIKKRVPKKTNNKMPPVIKKVVR